MAGPLIVSFWMRAAVTFIDTAYAAREGDAAVAAVGLAVPFEFLMIALWVGLSTGLTSALSRAMGARQGRRIEQYLAATWRLVLSLAPLFMLLGGGIWLAARHVGLEAETAGQFRIYGSVLVAGSALTTFWSIIPDSLVKAHQDTRSTMWAGIWTNVLNVVLNTLFVFGFGWGVFGIALSTVIGRIGGLAYALVRARHHERARLADPRPWGTDPDPAPYRAILGLAVPASLTFSLMALESAVVNGLLASMRNATEAIAAYSIYYRTAMFALQPMIATSVAMLPYAAHRIGAGDLDGVRRGLRQAGGAAVAYAVALVTPVLWFGAPWLAAMLTESELTASYTVFALRCVPLACLSGAPFLLSRPVFEAMNRGRPGLIMAVIRYVVLTGPLAWLGIVAARGAGLPALHGLIGGLLAAGALSSGLFAAWLARALRGEARLA